MPDGIILLCQELQKDALSPDPETASWFRSALNLKLNILRRTCVNI